MQDWQFKKAKQPPSMFGGGFLFLAKMAILFDKWPLSLSSRTRRRVISGKRMGSFAREVSVLARVCVGNTLRPGVTELSH